LDLALHPLPIRVKAQVALVALTFEPINAAVVDGSSATKIGCKPNRLQPIVRIS
jgi:hypothetical protein